MNKEHKSNVLSESFMSDIRRSLEAIEINEDVRAAIIKSKEEQVFSMGTDLNYLYYKKKSGQIDKINEYFENLYNFHNFIASYHKPLFTLGTGVTSNLYIYSL
jgi:enoyl-CoA hydratase/carnithine racemase